MSLRIGICLIAIGVLSFGAALVTADWRWLLVTTLCWFMARGR